MNGLLAALIKILVILVVVAVHAYFVATEYSLVTLRRTRIDQLATDGHRAARLVQATLLQLSEFVAAVQLGVTMASLALGALAEPTIAAILAPAFGFISSGWRPVTAHGVAVALTFLLITAVDIVVAELVPKTVALQSPEQVAFLVIRPIRMFMWTFRPFIRLLNEAGSLLIRVAGLDTLGGREAHSQEELKMIVAASTRAGILDADEQEMLFRVLEFSHLTARQVMLPRTEVVGLEIAMSRKQVYDVLRSTSHTRYPVYRGTIDDVAGILYVRDLLARYPVQDAGALDLTRIMREPVFVPDSVRIDDLLARMKRARVQIVVVLDEYGQTDGIVTMEDLLERIVGEVRDEFEQVGADVVELSGGEAVIDGLVLVSDVNERFHLNLDDDDYDTLGGLVMGELGRMPEVGDEVARDGWRLRVEELDGRRVARVRLVRTERASASDDASESEPPRV